MLSITVIVVIVAAVSGLANVRNEEGKLLGIMTLGADQLSNAIVSATWHAMLDDHREAAYQVMQTIALKQGIDRIRMFNRSRWICPRASEFSSTPTGAGGWRWSPPSTTSNRAPKPSATRIPAT